MNKYAAIVGLALVVLGALWLSGSSTLLLGVRQGVPGYALPSLLVVLEIASVVGTALWVTAHDNRSRVRPVVVTILASGVAAIGGWLAYGPLGLVAPMAVVLVTDMIAERWSKTDVAAPVVQVDPAAEDDMDDYPALHAVPTTYTYVQIVDDIDEREARDAEEDAADAARCDEAAPVQPHPVALPDPDDHPLVTVDQLGGLSRDELRVVARDYDVTVRGSADARRGRLRPVLERACAVRHEPCEASA